MNTEVKVLAASQNVYTGKKIVTFELDYPRFIHSEILTHRQFSRNAQSSRAVPINKTLEANASFVKPLVWGKNKAGMSSTEVLQGVELESAKELWDCAARNAFAFSKALGEVNLHKQHVNRITEPFSRIKVILTATEFDNFFWLRQDKDAAQPEIVELANKMKEAYDNTTCTALRNWQWHLPYVTTQTGETSQRYFDSNGDELSLKNALKVSASCAAQVSYRKLDDSKQKALEIYDRLFAGPKPHLSPVEHQAMCFDPQDKSALSEFDGFIAIGLTHVDRNNKFWSGNFMDFIQHRQVIQQS